VVLVAKRDGLLFRHIDLGIVGRLVNRPPQPSDTRKHHQAPEERDAGKKIAVAREDLGHESACLVYFFMFRVFKYRK
jgi:hypothetical protein